MPTRRAASSAIATRAGELGAYGILLAEGESVHLVAGSDNRARVLPDDLLALVQEG